MSVRALRVGREAAAGCAALAVAPSAALTTVSFTAGSLSSRDAELVHTELRAAGEVMHTLQQQWQTVTTATRPSHEYVTATTALHASLSSLEPQSLPQGWQADAAKRIDVDQALADLRYAATDLVELTNTASLLPEPLIRSGLLFAPARILPSTMERLNDRNHGRYVAIQLSEGAELIDASKLGASAARQAQTTLQISAQAAATTELNAQPPAGRISRREFEPATSLGGPDLL